MIAYSSNYLISQEWLASIAKGDSIINATLLYLYKWMAEWSSLFSDIPRWYTSSQLLCQLPETVYKLINTIETQTMPQFRVPKDNDRLCSRSVGVFMFAGPQYSGLSKWSPQLSDIPRWYILGQQLCQLPETVDKWQITTIKTRTMPESRTPKYTDGPCNRSVADLMFAGPPHSGLSKYTVLWLSSVIYIGPAARSASWNSG